MTHAEVIVKLLASCNVMARQKYDDAKMLGEDGSAESAAYCRGQADTYKEIMDIVSDWHDWAGFTGR